MALTLANTIETVDSGTNLLITDTTVYGTGGNAVRASCFVNFTVLDMRNDPPSDITPYYDPETVEEILVTIPYDGWYKGTMSITPNPDGDSPLPEPDELVKDYISSALFCICKANFANKIFSCMCGCENPTKIQELFCLEAQLAGLLDLIAENDMVSAAQAIERMNLECALYNEDCGCH